jgi:hypothetical protein
MGKTRLTKKIYVGGHRVYLDEKGLYRYKDDGSLVPLAGDRPFSERPCPKCKLNPKDFGGHDPCIASLPGVIRACCGHGGLKKGHILFNNGVLIKGDFSVGFTDLTEWRRKHGRE